MLTGAATGLLVALVVFSAMAWQRLQDASGVDLQRPIITELQPERPAVVPTADVEDARHIYRYSVVPGGVQSPEELLEAMASDGVVAEHYSGVNITRLRTERLREPMRAHVSYRIGDKVYWTKRKLTLQAGEQILTDGQTMVRARCGNCVSVDPLLPTLDNEPTPEALDSIEAPIAAVDQSRLDPNLSYLTPPHLTSSPLLPNASGVPFNTPSSTGIPPSGLPPIGGTPGGSSGAPPNGGTVPPGGNPPGNPPGANPPGGNPPSDDPPGGPPPEFTPKDVPDPPTPVPEPGTLLLVAAGVVALLATRLRKST